LRNLCSLGLRAAKAISSQHSKRASRQYERSRKAATLGRRQRGLGCRYQSAEAAALAAAAAARDAPGGDGAWHASHASRLGHASLANSSW